jgi:hypothetical protein
LAICWLQHRTQSTPDIKTLAMAMLKKDYRASTKRNVLKRRPKFRLDKLPHTHRALDNAIEQGALFCNMLAEHHAS